MAYYCRSDEMNPYYKDYARYLNEIFPGLKLQKLSVNTDHGCPNRDGTKGSGGCIYCNNESFTPSYCFGISGVKEQLEAGKRFFGRKYKNMEYLAYFQSYTSTYGSNLEQEIREAMEVPGIRGLIIGGRPDCINGNVTDMLGKINREMPVFVEIGVETLHDDTLSLINRGHDSATAEEAIKRTAGNGLHTGVHLIAGLPGESREMMLDTVERVCCLPIESLKMHHLQVLRGSALHHEWEAGRIDINPFDMEDYLDFCERVVKIVPERIAIERFLAQAPPAMVVAPKWNVKNYVFTAMLRKRLAAHNTGNL